jgi:urea transporter
MQSTQFTVQQLMFYGAIVGAMIGLLLGLVPLILGLKRGERRLGIVGFLCCLIGGAVASVIISIPSVIIFTWLIVRKSRQDGPEAADQ